MFRRSKPVVGWREWVSLPELGPGRIKVKVDTGARTSALHASEIKYLKNKRIKFKVHPKQDSSKGTYTAITKFLGKRRVKSSTGESTLRPVIQTTLRIGELEFPIELTLVNRDMMGFRMLLGRQALRDQFVVDPQRSFLIGKSRKKSLSS